MLTRYIRLLLFLSSYYPLFAIVMITHYEQIEVFYILIPTIALSTIELLRVFRKLNKIGGNYKVGNNDVSQGIIENTGKATLQYFLTYIVPLLAFNLTDWQEFVTFGIIFFIIGVLYIKSDLIYLNPTLLLLRFNIYKVRLGEREIVVISKNNNKNRITNPVIEIGAGVYFERGQPNTDSDTKKDTTFSS